MMTIKLFQVDAFADRLFTGNPAAVCPLEDWLDDSQLQAIAAENNLAETAFFVFRGGHFEIRWFTPAVEVRLCGHATLASAHVLMSHLGYAGNRVEFQTRQCGSLSVVKNGDQYVLDFPVDKVKPVASPKAVIEAIGVSPVECFLGETDYMLVFESQSQIEGMDPNFHLLKKIDCRAVIVTAVGDECDFVSRFFAPQVGIDEDPVTGSAHTTLTPYWSKKLGKTELVARQLSKRGGTLFCKDLGERVQIGGFAQTYLQGQISL